MGAMSKRGQDTTSSDGSPQENGVVSDRTSKLKVPKCIDKRRSTLPQGNLGRKSKPDQKVKRTLLAQGNLMRRYFNAYRRNWEELQ